MADELDIQQSGLDGLRQQSGLDGLRQQPGLHGLRHQPGPDDVRQQPGLDGPSCYFEKRYDEARPFDTRDATPNPPLFAIA
jgi:hypothetical protein